MSDRDIQTNPYAGQGFLCYRELATGEPGRCQLLALLPLLFDGGSITLGPGGEDYEGEYSQAWEFENIGDAYLQFLLWNPAEQPEPKGWARHYPSMRKRGEELAAAEVGKGDRAQAKERDDRIPPHMIACA